MIAEIKTTKNLIIRTIKLCKINIHLSIMKFKYKLYHRRYTKLSDKRTKPNISLYTNDRIVARMKLLTQKIEYINELANIYYLELGGAYNAE